jgi:phosphocarrier protein HPr
LKFIRKVRVKNSMGLHTRPATWIVKMLQNVKCDVQFTHKSMTVNAKSILSILMLAAKKNSRITIIACGEDAEETVDKLFFAFENQFEETS